MANIDFQNIRNTLESLEVDSDRYSVKFDMSPTRVNDVDVQEGTRFFMVRTNVTAKNKSTGEEITFLADLLKVPSPTHSGFIVKGKSKQVIDEYTMSHGWYVMEKTKGIPQDHLKLLPERGNRLLIFHKDFELMITTGKEMNQPHIPLAQFLKALTGDSYATLARRLGGDSVYTMVSFDSSNEPTRPECIDRVMTTLMKDYAKGSKKEYELSLLSGEEKFLKISDRFLHGRMLYLGDTAGVRLSRMLSFQTRAKNTYLDEDIQLGKYKFTKGQPLDSKYLEQLDFLPVDSLKVSDSSHKSYVLRKSSIHNFRALGLTLAKEVVLSDGAIMPIGTVLTIDDLRKLNKTNHAKIEVEGSDGVVPIQRNVFNGSLKIEDLIGVLQVYIDSLSGLNLYDNIYSMSNQNLKTVNLLISSLLKANCHQIINSLLGAQSDYSGAQDLLQRHLVMQPVPTDGVLEFISNAETRESQQAELNNTLQKAAKDYRTSKNVKRSSDGMRGVQTSHFSRLDTIESPESSKIGTVHSKTFFAKVDELGFLTAPYMRVDNGEIIGDEPVYLTYEEEENEFIASWDETFYEELPDGTRQKKKMIWARSSKTFLEVPISEVRFAQVSPFDDMSPSRMQLTFIQHSQTKRQLMGANQHRQAITLLKNERGLVGSGGECLLNEGFITARQVLMDYYTSENITSISRDEFAKKSVKLVGVAAKKDFKELALEIQDWDGPGLTIEIPFMQKASSGALFSYEINTRTGRIYQNVDVIAHAMDISIEKHTVYKHVDFGHLKVDENMYNQAFAPSRNVLVAFKTHEGSTIDDSVTMSDDMVGMELMTVMDVYREEYELSAEKVNTDNNTVEVESFGFTHATVPPGMTASGVPEVGRNLKAGDLVIAVKSEEKQATRGEGYISSPARSKNVYLSGNHEGMVLAAWVENNKSTVLIGTVKQIEPGDKIAGRHGNKGVLARIVPRSMMPFDPETGEPVQVILNPQGVPSRINNSQMLEGPLALAMRLRGNNEVCVVTPYKSDSLDFVREMADSQGAKPRVLIDGRTGLPFKRPINVVMLYILRLEHQVSHKLKAVGADSPLDPVFNQPSKGDGGQAFGEMETWALELIGARKVLDDVLSVQSDDLDAIKSIKHAVAEDYRSVEVEGENHNDDFFQVIHRCLGVEPEYDKEGNLVFKPLTDLYTQSLNFLPVDIYNKDSLSSRDIFGITTNSLGKFHNRSNWSWMPLRCEIIHPFFIVKGKLNRLMLVHYASINKKGQEVLQLDFANEGLFWELIAQKMHLEVSDNKFIVRKNRTPDTFTGMSAVLYLFRNVNVDDSLKYLYEKLEGVKSENSELRIKKHIREIEDFKASGIQLTDYIISTLPVMPLSLRPKPKFAHLTQDFDFYYSRIMDEIVRYNSSASKGEGGVYAIFLRIAEFCGLKHKEYIRPTEGYKPLLKYFTGREGPDSKHGRLRESMMKKRTLFSGRTPIIPSTDTKRLPTQIGLPFVSVVTVWKLHLTYLMMDQLSHYKLELDEWESLLDLIATNRSQFEKVAWQLAPEHAASLYDVMYKIIKVYIEGYTDPVTKQVVAKPQVVLAGRQPTLHKFNIRAYHPVIVSGRCIEIHPVVCPLYNADFDGDQMWFLALINDSAKEEAMRLMSAQQGIVNPKDGSIIMSHSQDMRLGVYFATMLHNNVDSITKDSRYNGDYMVYNNLNLLENDVDMGFISVHDIVYFLHEGRRYVSTVGRILFNSQIPEGLGFTDEPFDNTALNIPDINTDDFCALRFDGLVSGNGGKRKTPKYVSLQTVGKFCYENLTDEKNLAYIQAVSEFGFKHSDLSGITLSLDDLQEYPNTAKYVEIAKEHAAQINNRYFEGMLSEQERKDELIFLYSQCREKIKSSFMSQFDRNNNMFIMYDSGARGNEDQIIQSSGIIGILQKTKAEALEVPVLNNYIRGVTAFEALQLAYSTRLNVASTQNETAESGELSRLATYMGGGLTVIANDCGVDFTNFKLKWARPTGKVKYPNGEFYETTSLVGKKLKDDPEVEKYLRNFLPESGEITEKCLGKLFLHKVQYLNCEDGRYEIFYRLDSLHESLLLNRESKELPHLRQGKYITKKTIEWIKSANPTHIPLRTMLRCKCVGGVCAHCYGLRYDTNTLPPIGFNVGVEAAECISEPASQLSLSLFHGGGIAGKSVDKGVELYKSFLKTGFSPKVEAATLARFDGYVSIQSDKHRPVVKALNDPDYAEIHFTKLDPILEDGDYVSKYSPISQGVVLLKDRMINPTPDEHLLMQLSMLEAQFRIFEANNITVLARHFEVFAKIQTGICTILESEDPKFKIGGTYQVSDVINNSSPMPIYRVEGVGSSKVIQIFSGLEALLVHSDLAGNLGYIVSTGMKAKNPSFLGKIAQGKSMSNDTPKIFKAPAKIHRTPQIAFADREEPDKVVEALLSEEYIKEIEAQEEVLPDLEDFDWDLATGTETVSLPAPEPEAEVEVDELTLDDSDQFGEPTQVKEPEQPENNNTEGSDLKQSSAFGG